MKKKILLIIGLVVIICLVIVLIRFKMVNKTENSSSTDVDSIPTVSQIELGSKQYINQLEKVKIKGTNDTVMITQRVKWEVPDYGPDVTVSFAIAVPYTITIDGKDYNGIYELNDASWSTLDNNPKYSFEVTNLTKNGDIEILITNK